MRLFGRMSSEWARLLIEFEHRHSNIPVVGQRNCDPIQPNWIAPDYWVCVLKDRWASYSSHWLFRLYMSHVIRDHHHVVIAASKRHSRHWKRLTAMSFSVSSQRVNRSGVPHPVSRRFLADPNGLVFTFVAFFQSSVWPPLRLCHSMPGTAKITLCGSRWGAIGRTCPNHLNWCKSLFNSWHRS